MCDPYNGQEEICGDGIDNNCDGNVDEGCQPPGPWPPPPGPPPPKQPGEDPCGNTAGDDPIMLSAQSAVTEPFTDFSVDTGLVPLGVTRTYASNDWSYSGGPVGVFGHAWHHDWEGWLSCSGGLCTVEMGGGSGTQFSFSASALSLDGTETWQTYQRAFAPAVYGQSDGYGGDQTITVLARRPSGEWILFANDGRELHFNTVCDACSNPGIDPYCKDAASGGKARLVRVVDARGTSVQVAYNRPGGVLVSLADDLGHSLTLQSTSACSTGLATALQYDGVTVATYSYIGSDLAQATDSDGAILRKYSYDPTSGRLLAVTNEGNDAIASFAYDAMSRAVGVIDKTSSVSIDYATPGSPRVVSYFGGTSSTCSRTFDRYGHVTNISDGCACGPARTFVWDYQKLTDVIDTNGHSTYSSYDQSGGRSYYEIDYVVNGYVRASRTSNWSYGQQRTVAQGVSVPLNRPSRYYDGGPGVTIDYDPTSQSIDPPGYSCQQAPLPTASVECRRIELGNIYSSSGTEIRERHATFYSYDARGRLTRTLGPINLDYPSASDVMPLEERVYWADTESLPRRGRLHQLKRYPSPTGTPLVTTYDYDMFGPYQITQPNGGTTTIVKDGRGRPTNVINADGGLVHTRYYDGLDARIQVLPSGRAVRSSYDTVGRPASIEYLSSDPDGAGTTATFAWGQYFTYDVAGNRTHIERRDATGVVTWRLDQQFDLQHRTVSETNPANPTASRTTTFDGSGFLQSVVDEQGRATTYSPDPFNRVGKVTRSGLDANGAPASVDVARYSYGAGFVVLNDQFGNIDSLAEVIDGKGQSTTYLPDQFGRQTVLTSPNQKGGQVQFAYDARGNLLQKSDLYVTVIYTYDGLNRALTMNATNAADSSSLSYTYRYDESGAAGQLTTVVEPDRTVQFGYDLIGRRTTEAIHENGVSAALVTQWVYATDGAVTDIIYASGLHVQMVRDPATRGVTRLVNVADGSAYASAVTRLPGGPVTGLTFGNGLTLSQAFNLRYEPQSVASGPLALGYTMTPAGDVGSATEAGVARNFGYDFLGRLTGAPSWLSYAYDNNGNRTSETVAGAVGSYQFTADLVTKRLTSGNMTQYGYGYDYQANVSGVAVFDSTGTKVTAATCLLHDALGRMVLAGPVSSKYLSPSYFNGNITCTQSGQVSKATAKFKYDSRGRRIARWLASTGQWTYIVSDAAGNPLSELVMPARSSGTWTKVRDYVWLEGRPIAQIEYPGPSGNSQGYNYYVHVDHIGLPRYLTNSAKQTVWSTTERPYGDVVEMTSTDPVSGRVVQTNLRLPGQHDERLLGSLGLQGPYYNWNRWYLPGTGRYLEMDPLALQGVLDVKGGLSGGAPEWFAYAHGNPLSYTDSKGLYGTKCCGYYQMRCAASPNNSWYCYVYQQVCNQPLSSPASDCIRKCLQEYDKDHSGGNIPQCLQNPYGPIDFVTSHKFCFEACLANPDVNPFTGDPEENDTACFE